MRHFESLKSTSAGCLGPHVTIRADGSTQLGMGHVMRCLALAQALESRGIRSLYVGSPGSAGQAVFQTAGIETTDAEIKGWDSDAEGVRRAALENASSWIILDGPNFRSEYLTSLTGTTAGILLLDDDGRAELPCVDVLCNPQVYAERSMYPRAAASTRFLLGSRYAIVRSAFVNAKKRPRANPGHIKNVVVTMGGSDPEGGTLRVLKWLASAGNYARDLEIRTIIGPAYAESSVPDLLGVGGTLSLQVLRNPADLVDQFQWADVAISASGGTTVELAVLGIPMLLLPLANNQRLIAAAFETRGLAIVLPDDFERIAPTDAIQTALELPRCSAPGGEAGAEWLDGEGASRIVSTLFP